MFAGMFDMEHRIYTIWPCRGVMAVLQYLVFGPTLFAARIASVVMALLFAMLGGIVVRRVPAPAFVGLDWLALVAVMTSPLAVKVSRFARAEIDVAAWSMLMVACLQTLDRVEESLWCRAWAMVTVHGGQLGTRTW